MRSRISKEKSNIDLLVRVLTFVSSADPVGTYLAFQRSLLLLLAGESFPFCTRPTIMGSETENKTGFPFIVQKPASSAIDNDGSCCSLPAEGKA